MGFCGRGPLVAVDPAQTLYERVLPEDAPSIVNVLKGGKATATLGDLNHPFFAQQLRIALENIGKIDPDRIDAYIAIGGYHQLYRVLHEMSPQQVIEEVTRSGLRGRGGAGYPTGLKWSTVEKMPGSPKYVICNADEGDPGAFMDRSILESDPHRVWKEWRSLPMRLALVVAMSMCGLNIPQRSNGFSWRLTRQSDWEFWVARFLEPHSILKLMCAWVRVHTCVVKKRL
jgi:hypothetical protein